MLLACSIVLAAGLVLFDQLGFPFREVLRDPNGTAFQPWWTGFASLLGLIAWGAAATLFACSAWLRSRDVREGDVVAFLGIGAGIFLVAGVDDALMLHEQALTQGSAREQAVVYAAYAGLAGGWVLRFRRELAGRPLLLVAMSCFAASVVIDALEVSDFLEDYAKYVALCGLFLAGLAELGAAAPRPARAEAIIERGADEGPRAAIPAP